MYRLIWAEKAERENCDLAVSAAYDVWFDDEESAKQYASHHRIKHFMAYKPDNSSKYQAMYAALASNTIRIDRLSEWNSRELIHGDDLEKIKEQVEKNPMHADRSVLVFVWNNKTSRIDFEWGT